MKSASLTASGSGQRKEKRWNPDDESRMQVEDTSETGTCEGTVLPAATLSFHADMWKRAWWLLRCFGECSYDTEKSRSNNIGPTVAAGNESAYRLAEQEALKDSFQAVLCDMHKERSKPAVPSLTTSDTSLCRQQQAITGKTW